MVGAAKRPRLFFVYCAGLEINLRVKRRRPSILGEMRRQEALMEQLTKSLAENQG